MNDIDERCANGDVIRDEEDVMKPSQCVAQSSRIYSEDEEGMQDKDSSEIKVSSSSTSSRSDSDNSGRNDSVSGDSGDS